MDCSTLAAIGTVTRYAYYSEIGVLAPTWTSEFAKPSPTCKVAKDLSPMCARLFEAWTYRAEQMQAVSPVASDVDWRVTQAIPPCTPLMNVPAATDRPLCRANGGTYSVYHWPTAMASGQDFCNAHWTAPMGTPTIPGFPNTAVVSGVTLTSPDVYHFLNNMSVETYRGRAGQPGGIGNAAYDVWALSTVVPVITVAQSESDILQASKRCIGIEADQCTMYFVPDFRIQELATVRTDSFDKYCKSQCGSREDGVLYQDCYQPSLAIPIREIVRQNSGVFGECDWPLYEANNEGGWTSHTTSSVAAVLIKDVKATAFMAVVTSERAGKQTTVPLPGSPVRLEARPTNSP